MSASAKASASVATGVTCLPGGCLVAQRVGLHLRLCWSSCPWGLQEVGHFGSPRSGWVLGCVKPQRTLCYCQNRPFSKTNWLGLDRPRTQNRPPPQPPGVFKRKALCTVVLKITQIKVIHSIKMPVFKARCGNKCNKVPKISFFNIYYFYY